MFQGFDHLASDQLGSAAEACECDDVAFFTSYIENMRRELDVAVEAISNDIQDVAAWKQIKELAHKLKSSAPLYGHEHLGKTAGRAEFAVMNEADQACVVNLVNEFAKSLRNFGNKQLNPKSEAHPSRDDSSANLTRASKINQSSTTNSTPKTENLFNVSTSLRNQWMSGYLARHFEEIANFRNFMTAEDLQEWSIANHTDLFVFEHTATGIDGVALAKQTVLRNQMKNAPCLVAFYPGVSGRAVAEIVALGGHTVIVDETNPRQLADRIESLLSQSQSRILLVDDDSPVQKILSDVFAGAGVHVDVAHDGIEALDHLKSHRPDLIILDSMMPRLDGESTLHEIQSRTEINNIPVLVLTGANRMGSAARWFRRGAVDFISKPFDPEEVLARVLRHLEIAH